MKIIQLIKDIFLFLKQIFILLLMIAAILYWLVDIITDKQEEKINSQIRVVNTK